ncbi:trans-sialidase [Trypanosoma cruzi]|nr:trans-sialidase [Trypanosoma cruzi]
MNMTCLGFGLPTLWPGTSRLRRSGRPLSLRSPRGSGGHAPCLAVGMAMIVCVICTGPQQLQGAVRCFYLGSDTVGYDSGDDMWEKDGWDIQLVVGKATHSTDGVQSTLINWAEPKLLSQHIPHTHSRSPEGTFDCWWLRHFVAE